MEDTGYFTSINGDFVRVPPIDDLCLVLKEKFLGQLEREEYLTKRIKELENENWKDEELQKMKKEYTEMKEDYFRGFPISKEESERIYAWIKEHEEKKHSRKRMNYPRGGAIGGCYTYYFTPTSIGVFGTIKCNCGEEFTFQEI